MGAATISCTPDFTFATTLRDVQFVKGSYCRCLQLTRSLPLAHIPHGLRIHSCGQACMWRAFLTRQPLTHELLSVAENSCPKVWYKTNSETASSALGERALAAVYPQAAFQQPRSSGTERAVGSSGLAGANPGQRPSVFVLVQRLKEPRRCLRTKSLH